MFSSHVFVAIILLTTINKINGYITYNPDIAICCNGMVEYRDDNTVCCGSHAIDYKKFLCCDEKILPIPENGGNRTDYGCCYNSNDEPTVANLQTQQCCDGIPVDRPGPNPWYGCCNGQLYDEETHLCCNNSLQERLEHYQCCVDRLYDETSETCCEEWGRGPDKKSWVQIYYHVIPHNGTRKLCCGHSLYDPATESCCKQEIHPKPEGIPLHLRAACCTNEPYDARTQLCCIRGDVIDGVYKVEDYKIHSDVGDGRGCCGLEAFDSQTEACCNITIQPKPKDMPETQWGACCGDQVINFITHICHENKLVERSNVSDVAINLCWDGAWYNSTSQICCGGQILQRDSDEDCCYTIDKKYTKGQEVCCDDQVVPLSQEDKANGRSICCDKPHILNPDLSQPPKNATQN